MALSRGRRIQMRKRLYKKQFGRCCYCLRQVRVTGKPDKDFGTIEHLHRAVDGGSDHNDNLALACFECNTMRGDQDWLTFTSLRRGEITVGELP